MRGQGARGVGVQVLALYPFAVVPLKKQARRVRCCDEKKLRGHCVPRTRGGGCEIIDKSGVVEAAGLGDSLDNWVVTHGPVKHAHRATHAYTAEYLA